MLKNYAITGVGNSLQLGKRGATIISVADSATNKEVLVITDVSSSLTQLRAAAPVSGDDVVTKIWCNASNIPLGVSTSGAITVGEAATVAAAISSLSLVVGEMQSDTSKLQRANHTGTQPLETITGVGNAASHDVSGPIATSIIERGSNANGEYTKFADGTMMCTFVNAPPAIVSGYEISHIWAYPQEFISTPAVTASIKSRVLFNTRSISYHGVIESSTTGATAGVLTNAEILIAADALGVMVDYQAIGRWK